MTKSETIRFRVSTEDRALLDRVSAYQHTSISEYLRRLIHADLRQNHADILDTSSSSSDPFVLRQLLEAGALSPLDIDFSHVDFASTPPDEAALFWKTYRAAMATHQQQSPNV